MLLGSTALLACTAPQLNDNLLQCFLRAGQLRLRKADVLLMHLNQENIYETVSRGHSLTSVGSPSVAIQRPSHKNDSAELLVRD